MRVGQGGTWFGGKPERHDLDFVTALLSVRKTARVGRNTLSPACGHDLCLVAECGAGVQEQ